MNKVISSLFLNSQKTRDNMYGYGASGKVTNQILINSDRVSLNSNRDDIYISSSESIHIGSGDYITLSSNRDLIIDSRQTMLGNPFSPSGQRLLMQPMVLGSELLEIIRDILKLLKFLVTASSVSLPTSNPSSTDFPRKLILLKKIQNYIQSTNQLYQL